MKLLRTFTILLAFGIGLVIVFVVWKRGATFAKDECSASQVLLDQGAQAYRVGKYEEACIAFAKASETSPKCVSVTTRVWIATGCPNTEANTQREINKLQKLLEQDPTNLDAIKGVAYLELQERRFEDSKAMYRRAIEISPKDPEFFYSVAVIDWSQAYQRRMTERARLGLKPTDPLYKRPTCKQLRAANWKLVEDGMANLTRALTPKFLKIKPKSFLILDLTTIHSYFMLPFG